MSEFLAQGGFGFYVWMAYGVTAALMIAEIIALAHKHRTILKRLGRLVRARTGGGSE